MDIDPAVKVVNALLGDSTNIGSIEFPDGKTISTLFWEPCAGRLMKNCPAARNNQFSIFCLFLFRRLVTWSCTRSNRAHAYYNVPG